MGFTRSGVASTLRAEMARRDISQREVAVHLQLSQAAFSDRMRGRTPFTLDQMAAVADLFGMTIGELVDERVPASA